MMATADPDRRVCPRCGGDAGEHQFCPVCGLRLVEQGELPTRAQWERDVAAKPWPGPGGDTGAEEGETVARAQAQAEPVEALGAEQREPDRAVSGPSSRGRTVLEVGVPLLVLAVLAYILFAPGGGSKVPGSLHYDRWLCQSASGCGARGLAIRAAPCSALIHKAPSGATVRPVNCPKPVWSARRNTSTFGPVGCSDENCISAAGYAGNVCPPPVPAVLMGCIRA